tara:strand:+ start:710 stop:1189 length:480 start_codon:yes stop_codon:yes gene_type:complete
MGLMKKLSLYVFLVLMVCGQAFAKEVNLSCELSKYFIKESVLSDTNQIPLSTLDASQLAKVTISFDIDNEKFLGSNLIGPTEYKSVLFTDDEIYFMTKGWEDDNIFYYDTRLNRLTGELTRTIQPTKKYLKSQLKIENGTRMGYKLSKVYQCKVVDKLF